MEFTQGRNPERNLVGISIVVLVHIVVIYFLITGLASKVVEVIQHPLETKIIEVVKEPPRDTPPPPPPKLNIPPPPFIPPPEVQIQVPIVTNVISAVTNVKPVAPQPVTHPVESPKARLRKGIAPVFKVEFNYPRRATQDSVEGSVIAHAYVAKDGTVTEVKIVKADRPGYFEAEVIRALKQWKFTPDEYDYIVEVPVGFKLAD